MFATKTGAALLVLTSLVSVGVQAATEKGGVFVLPVDGSWPVGQSAVTVFEERLCIALGEGKHVRVVSQRDLPVSKRADLPKDLATCTAIDCVKKLADLAGVDRIVSLRMADEQGSAIVFSTLYEGSSGAAAKRKEWKLEPREPLSPNLTKAVAAWIVGEAPPAPPPAPKTDVWLPGLVSVELGKNQAASPDARALLSKLTSRLNDYADFAIRQSDGKTEPSHRAAIVVDHVAVSSRQHHVRHYFEGTLSATVTITDVAAQTIVFTSHAQSSVSTKTEHTSEAAVLGTMVTDVVDQWMSAFSAQGVSHNLRRKAKP